ncbi:MAG: type II secretion system F family protein, partial [Jatrophihabitantaceae bacterium]
MGALTGLLAGVGLLLIWRSGPRAPARAARRSSWSSRRDELIVQAGIASVSSRQLLSIQLIAAALAGLLVELITGTAAVAACFALFGFLAPIAIVRRLRQQRQVALRELWPEAIDNLASAVRAGMSLPEGLTALGEHGPEPLRPAFTRFGIGYRASGRFAECLDALKVDLSDPVGDRVCETLRVAREVGGSDLGTVLRTLSELLRIDARTRSELETRQGWTINAARLAVAAPWLVLLLLGSQSSTLRTFDSSGGVTLLVIG